MGSGDTRVADEVIVCGVDLAEEGQAVADVGGALAEQLGAMLHLIHVAPPPYVSDRPAGTLRERVRETEEFERAGHLRMMASRIVFPRRGPTAVAVEFGEPADVLARTAEAMRAGLLVIGSRGEGRLERAVVGSTPAALSRGAPAPVVVVPFGVDSLGGESIVCGVDGSKEATAAARVAADLAGRLSLRLDLVRIARRDDSGEEGEGSAAGPDPVDAPGPVEVVDAIDGPARALARLGAERQARLLVVGTRGRGAMTSSVLGSVAHELIDAASHPVVVVPPNLA